MIVSVCWRQRSGFFWGVVGNSAVVRYNHRREKTTSTRQYFTCNSVAFVFNTVFSNGFITVSRSAKSWATLQFTFTKTFRGSTTSTPIFCPRGPAFPRQRLTGDWSFLQKNRFFGQVGSDSFRADFWRYNFPWVTSSRPSTVKDSTGWIATSVNEYGS